MGDGGGGQGPQLKHFNDKMMIVDIVNISTAEIDTENHFWLQSWQH